MMKKFTILLLSIVLICPIFGYFDGETIYADSEYEVDYIEDNGSFTEIASYDNFAEAKAKMSENQDYVVRCSASLSPSKIIAMNSGLVYSYPARKSSKTTNIYEKLDSNLNGAGAYICVDSNEEMTYYETYSTSYSNSLGYQLGWVKITLNGFTGYIDLEYVDLVPTKFIEKGIPITLCGSPSSTYSVICKQKYYTAEEDDNYTDLVLHYFLGLPTSSSNNNAKEYTLHIGVAPSFMSEGTKYYSNDGINFYSDTSLSKLVGSYYNYYQFVPLRSYSNISGNVLDAYLKSKGYDNTSESILYGTGNDFLADQNAYGVNAVIIYAMALHESGFGTSTIARTKYNLFGWGAYDSNTTEATRYDSVLDCVKSQMADNLSNYLDESSNRYYWSMSLGNKGGGLALKYSSDPYWPEKIARYYYYIDKFANDYDGSLTDYNAETLALVTTTGANVYVSANENGGVWYTTQNKGTGYQKNLITIVLEKGATFTKVRTSNNIDGNGLLKPIQQVAGYIAPYNADTSVAYMKTSDLEILNTGSKNVESTYVQKTVDESSLTNYCALSDMSFNGSKLTVNGMAFLKGVSFDNQSIISHKLVLKNLSKGNEAVYDLTTSKRDGFTLNDGNDYQYIIFSGTADLSNIVKGQFALYIRVTNGKYTRDILLKTSLDNYSNVVSNTTDVNYHIYENEAYGYRLELEKTSTPFDYSKISKPSTRKSLFTLLDGFTLTAVGDSGANISLNAASMIYYCNYDKAENISFTVYLVKDNSNYLALSTNIVPKPEGFGSSLSQSYDTTNVAFYGSGDISNLKTGTYDIVIKITNGSYIDYVNAFTMVDITFPSLTNGNRTYTITRNSVNDRIQLTVS